MAQKHVPALRLAFAACAALVLTYVAETTSPHQSASTITLEPSFSPAGGYYVRNLDLAITCSHPDATLLFTLDGSVPTSQTGTRYTQPIHIDARAPAVFVVRARAILPDGELGPTASASYLMNVRSKLPIMSLIADPVDLWDSERGIHTHPHQRGREWERLTDVTFVDQDRSAGFHVSAGLRIHGKTTRSADKKAFRLYFRSEYGMNRLDYPLYPQGEIQSFKRLVVHNGGQESSRSPTNWALMRNPLAGNLALEMGVCASRSRPVLLFLNGEPWGIYHIRERIDRWFLSDHLGIASADLLDTPVINGAEAVIEGDRQHWDQLMAYVATHDLSDPAHMAYVETQVDLDNLIDYTILQIYTANSDWLHTNVSQFRPRTQGGRWQWFVWDSDWSFGLRPHSDVRDNVVQVALNPNHPDTGGRDTLLLRKLLDNPSFRNHFLTRLADLLNTTLSSATVLAEIDALAAELDADIVYETARWSSPSDWEANVDTLRNFARARPDVVRRQVVEAFGLEGTTPITVGLPASGMGQVAVNSVLPSSMPWTGSYLQGTDIQLTAVPAPGYRFAGWQGADLDQIPTLTITVSTALELAPRFEPLPRDAFRPGDVIIWDERAGDNQFELRVMRRGGLDLRGWRVTDNDTKTATDEGSLILGQHPSLARVPRGTTVRIIDTRFTVNVARTPADDLNSGDRLLVLHTSNPNLDSVTDPGFHLGDADNLVLLAPGHTLAFDDDQGIAFFSNHDIVTPASFGVWTDGVTNGFLSWR